MRSLGIRPRLLLALVASVTVALAVLILGFNLLLERSLSRSAGDLARGRAAAQLAQLRVADGRLRLAEAPDAAGPDSETWVFSRGRVLEAPRAGTEVAAVARRLAAGPARVVDVPAADVRLAVAPAVFGGRRLGAVVAAVSLVPYEATQRTALLGSLLFGVAVLLLVALLGRWLLAASLRPVARMTRHAATWSERDLGQRFGFGKPHDELTELAATLDALLDRLSASLRREQRFSAELSHELRTPLARVSAEAELALRRERRPEEYRAALEVVRRNAAELASIVDALVAAARHEAGGGRGTADAYEVARHAAETCAGLAEQRALEVELEPPLQPLRVGVESELAARILQPVLENACRYGRRRVRVEISRADGGVVYSVEDDGAGVAEPERERIFEPGVRGRSGRSDGDGAGLGLPLARRLAEAAAGEVEAVAAENCGGRFLVRLPAA